MSVVLGDSVHKASCARYMVCSGGSSMFACARLCLEGIRIIMPSVHEQCFNVRSRSQMICLRSTLADESCGWCFLVMAYDKWMFVGFRGENAPHRWRTYLPGMKWKTDLEASLTVSPASVMSHAHMCLNTVPQLLRKGLRSRLRWSTSLILAAQQRRCPEQDTCPSESVSSESFSHS